MLRNTWVGGWGGCYQVEELGPKRMFHRLSLTCQLHLVQDYFFSGVAPSVALPCRTRPRAHRTACPLQSRFTPLRLCNVVYGRYLFISWHGPPCFLGLSFADPRCNHVCFFASQRLYCGLVFLVQVFCPAFSRKAPRRFQLQMTGWTITWSVLTRPRRARFLVRGGRGPCRLCWSKWCVPISGGLGRVRHWGRGGGGSPWATATPHATLLGGLHKVLEYPPLPSPRQQRCVGLWPSHPRMPLWCAWPHSLPAAGHGRWGPPSFPSTWLPHPQATLSLPTADPRQAWLQLHASKRAQAGEGHMNAVLRWAFIEKTFALTFAELHPCPVALTW